MLDEELMDLLSRPRVVRLEDGEHIVVFAMERWIRNSSPRYTPGRRQEVLAEARLVHIGGSRLKMRIQIYV
jgi:hypothetical protein